MRPQKMAIGKQTHQPQNRSLIFMEHRFIAFLLRNLPQREMQCKPESSFQVIRKKIKIIIYKMRE